MAKSDLLELFGFGQKKPVSAESTRDSVQTWIPLADIQNQHALRKDGKLIGYLKVYPIDLSLMSEKEKRRIIQALKEAINSEKEPFEILTLPRPVDLETYLGELSGMVASTGNPNKRLVLRDSIEYAVKMVSSGSCVERQYYLIFVQEKGKKAEEDLLNRMKEMQLKLRIANLRTEICNDMEIMGICALYATPQTTSVMPKNLDISLIPMFIEGE